MKISLSNLSRTWIALALYVSVLGCSSADHALGTMRDLSDGAVGTGGDAGLPDAPLGTGGRGGATGTGSAVTDTGGSTTTTTGGAGGATGTGGRVDTGGTGASGGNTGGAGGTAGVGGTGGTAACPAGQTLCHNCWTQYCAEVCVITNCIAVDAGSQLAQDLGIPVSEIYPYPPQDTAPVTVAIVPGLKSYSPVMSSVPGFPFKPLASGSVPANPLYRWRTDYGTFALWSWSTTAGRVMDQGIDFTVGDTTVYLEYVTSPSDLTIPVWIHLDLIDGTSGEVLASGELSLGWTYPATLTVQ